MENSKKHGSALHLFGLLSDGGVHSHNTHLFALLEMANKNGLKDVYVHAFLDGRDTPPTSGLGYIKELEAKMQEIGVGKIATIAGRYYAMDRDTRWERVHLAYRALTEGTGEKFSSAVECMENTYEAGVNDEFVVPAVIMEGGKPTAVIKENDSVIFYNFRPDRAREITRAFCDPDFSEFARPQGRFPLHYVCFTDYDPTIPNKHVVFHAQSMNNTLGQYLSEKGIPQLRLAETTKYAHVTYFFNGGTEETYPGEDRILVDTPTVATFDLKPEMSAPEVAEKLAEAISSKKYGLIVANFANCDMVGHTGIMEAAIKAVEAVDTCLGKALEAAEKTGAVMFICADHGNAECMYDEAEATPFTAHTTNPVPFILYGKPGKKLADGGRLADIAPTLLDLMDLPKPEEMTGRSLLMEI